MTMSCTTSPPASATQVSSGSLARSLADGFVVQTHQVETKGDACLRSCPVLFQRDEYDEATRVTPPETPPSADISERSRKSSRIESGQKRSYEGMQGRQNGTPKPRKKFKYTILEVHGMFLMSCSSILTLRPVR